MLYHLFRHTGNFINVHGFSATIQSLSSTRATALAATSAEHLSNLAGLLHRAALLAERSGGANRGFVDVGSIASCAQAPIYLQINIIINIYYIYINIIINILYIYIIQYIVYVQK